MPDMHRQGELVFLVSNSAASLPAGETSAVAYTLASLMKDGAFLILEQPKPTPDHGVEKTKQP